VQTLGFGRLKTVSKNIIQNAVSITNGHLNTCICEYLSGGLAYESSTKQERFLGGSCSGGELSKLGLDGIEKACHLVVSINVRFQ
jgi:hypothetical protein